MDSRLNALFWTSLVLGGLFLLAALVSWWRGRKAVPKLAQNGQVVEHGGVGDTFKNAAELAKAMKDLDQASRMAVIGVVLVGVAALAAGLDSVADAVSDIAEQVADSSS